MRKIIKVNLTPEQIELGRSIYDMFKSPDLELKKLSEVMCDNFLNEIGLQKKWIRDSWSKQLIIMGPFVTNKEGYWYCNPLTILYHLVYKFKSSIFYYKDYELPE